MEYLAGKNILPTECKETANLLFFVDKIFDSVNGSHVKNKNAKPLLGPVTPNSVHHKMWAESIKIFNSMKFITSDGKKETVLSVTNWVWTLNGIQTLLKKLKDDFNVSSVWLRHLNQDPLENFFGALWKKKQNKAIAEQVIELPTTSELQFPPLKQLYDGPLPITEAKKKDLINSKGINCERVIVEVQCRPVIWDQSSEIFKDRNGKAWLDICKVLFENFDDWSEAEKNIQVKKLQQRWKTARDTYIRVRSTKKKLKSGSGSRANKTYIYYDMLSFLDSNSNTQGEESADNFNQSVEQNASPRTSQNNTIIEEDLINVPSTSSSVTKETRSSKKHVVLVAALHTFPSTMDNQVVAEKRHNVCEPDFARNEVTLRLFKLKTTLADPEAPAIPTAYNAAVSSLKDTGIDKIKEFPALKSIKTTLYKHRNAAFEGIWKKGKQLKLTKDKLTRRQVALSTALALLPSDKIIAGWFYVASQSPDDDNSKEFRNYMLRQWLQDDFIKTWRRYTWASREEQHIEIAQIVIQEILEQQAQPTEYICRPCWQRAERTYHRNIREARQEDDAADVLSTEPVASGEPIQMTLPGYVRTPDTRRTCVFQYCENSTRYQIPNNFVLRMLGRYNLLISENSRVCNEHLQEDLWHLLAVQQNNISEFTAAHIVRALSILTTHVTTDVLNFAQYQTISPNEFHTWTGLTHDQYTDLLANTPSLNDRRNKNVILAAVLVKLRTGDPNARLATILRTSESSFARMLKTGRITLMQDFVPLHLGFDHLSREDVARRNLTVPDNLFGNPDSPPNERKAITICDGTYIYIQKSSNYFFQRKSYSNHKYRNLLKPFLFVCCDGHIIEVSGPHAATTSDSQFVNTEHGA
ncbi:hypothetical protein PYW08_006099 [Mythimna loreyi]|uniref:Uncharacterized protein n=1 Tax=Mythimna loreyi TaxID=667449 RepID=A0ACC2QNL2_9NEOP|nr:hypothetical protein PYW08_006099 [Mythimna loreyi]